MNILLIILALIMIWRIAAGAKRGVVKELFGLINLIFVSLVLTLAFMIYRTYTTGDMTKLLPLIIAVVVLSIAYAIIKVVFSPAKLIAKLPLVSGVDKLLGVVIGALEVVLVFWILCCLLKYMDIALLEQYVAPMINENDFLAMLSQNNWLDKLLTMAMGKIV